MKLRIFLLCAFLNLSSVNADEHLIPEESEFTHLDRYDFDPYYANVKSAFKNAYDRNIFARLIVIPSFTPEYALAVAKEDETYKIIHFSPSHHIWAIESMRSYRNDETIDELASSFPESVEDVTVETCELNIPTKLGENLYKLWGEMLYRTRYIDQRPIDSGEDSTMTFGLDGTTYHFAFEHQQQVLNGKIWSPDEESPTGQFVEITNLMKRACLNSDLTAIEVMKNKIYALFVVLDRLEY